MAPYKLVAEVFLEGLHEAFASEEAMTRMAEALDLKMFDRTASSRIFLKRLLDHAEATAIPEGRPGKMSENRWDCSQVVAAMMEMEEDFSLLMQVIPNLFALPFDLKTPSKSEVESLAKTVADLGGPDPLAPKAKKIARDATNDKWVASYNKLLAIHKNYKGLTDYSPAAPSPGTSFRLSPKGSTPAFADTEGLTGHSPTLDDYLLSPLPSYRILYLSWAPDVAAANAVSNREDKDDGAYFWGVGPFVSRSGGDMLLHAVYSRKVAHRAWKIIHQLGSDKTRSGLYVMPRLFSTTILVADEDFDMLFNVLEGSKLHEEGVHVGLRRLQD